MLNLFKKCFYSALIILLIVGCKINKKEVKKDLNSTEVQLSPPPGAYSEAIDVSLKIVSSKLRPVSIQVKDANGSWSRHILPIHLEASTALHYRLVYSSDWIVEGDEKTADYVITPSKG